MGFSFYHLGHAPGVGLRRAEGAQGVIILFFRTSHVAVKFSLYGQTGDLGVRLKGQISLNFSYKVNF